MSPNIIEVNHLDASQRINQGDVITNVEFIEGVKDYGDYIEINKILFPYIVVLSQDCDLEQDVRTQQSQAEKQNQDKFLLSVLVAPLYTYEHFREGTHLRKLNLQRQRINSKASSLVKENRDVRYHYLPFPDSVDIVESVIDFKHYFGISVISLAEHKNGNYICTIKELYREQVSQRFANYLARIGLPNPEMNF